MEKGTQKKRWLVGMILLYFTAGVLHFVIPDFYLGVIPSWMPKPLLCVQLSGFMEIVLALSLLLPNLQKQAAGGIVAMLIVFLIGVHIPMVLNFTNFSNIIWWVAIARLPLQWLLIRWAMGYTKGKVISFVR